MSPNTVRFAMDLLCISDALVALTNRTTRLSGYHSFLIYVQEVLGLPYWLRCFLAFLTPSRNVLG